MNTVSKIAAALGLALAAAWGEPSGAAGSAPEASAAPAASHAEDPAAAKISMASASAVYSEHAPLALFSLGSLAVGGVFYGINGSMHRSNISYTAADRSQLTSAVAIAGVSALLAAGSYFYYAHHAAARAEAEGRDWDAQVTGGVSRDGNASIGALVTLPLPPLSR